MIIIGKSRTETGIEISHVGVIAVTAREPARGVA
jgi:hypothetical protein